MSFHLCNIIFSPHHPLQSVFLNNSSSYT